MSLPSAPVVNPSDPAPPHHLTDWGSAWSFALFMFLTLLAWAVACFALRIVGELSYDGYGYSQRQGNEGLWKFVAGTVALFATLGAAWLHWYVARHFEEHSALWLIFVFLPPLVLAWVASRLDTSGSRRYGYGLAVTGLLAGLFGAANDALSRLASSIPIGLTTLVVGLVALVVFGGFYIATQSSSSSR